MACISKKAMQHRPRLPARDFPRFPDLPLDLRFAEDHRIEARRHPVEVPHGIAVALHVAIRLRTALARSPWRHGGSVEAAPLATALQLTWADRVATEVPPARPWAVAGAAVLLARSRFLDEQEPDEAGRRHAASLLGRRALAARPSSWAR